MVLAEAVRQPDGTILLPDAFELGEVQLASLMKRGVAEITVVVPMSEGESAVSSMQHQALTEAARNEVQHLFRKSETDAATQALMQAVLEYRLEKLL